MGVSGGAITEREVAEAYARYGPLVLLRCRRILRDPGAAEDALQEVFLRLWRYGEGFRGAESKVSWLYRVAERCCFDRLARQKRRAEVPLEDQPEQGNAALAPVEDWNVVVRFFGQLEQRLQRVAVLHYIDELTQEEIAAEVGWSRQTVAKKLDLLRRRAAKARARLTGEEQGA
jgi:RNA polymerase sigma-70 factor (ECF subfamily)